MTYDVIRLIHTRVYPGEPGDLCTSVLEPWDSCHGDVFININMLWWVMCLLTELLSTGPHLTWIELLNQETMTLLLGCCQLADCSNLCVIFSDGLFQSNASQLTHLHPKIAANVGDVCL